MVKNSSALVGTIAQTACILIIVVTMIMVVRPVSVLAGVDEATSAFSAGKLEIAKAEFRKLAEQGNPEAEFMLGVMYFQGRGFKQDRSIAAIWFHKAALKGHGGAQLAFGSVHIRGVGVYQNLHQAYKWLALATSSKSGKISEQAKNLLKDAAQLMTPDEIRDAKEDAGTFKAISSGLTSS